MTNETKYPTLDQVLAWEREVRDQGYIPGSAAYARNLCDRASRLGHTAGHYAGFTDAVSSVREYQKRDSTTYSLLEVLQGELRILAHSGGSTATLYMHGAHERMSRRGDLGEEKCVPEDKKEHVCFYMEWRGHHDHENEGRLRCPGCGKFKPDNNQRLAAKAVAASAEAEKLSPQEWAAQIVDGDTVRNNYPSKEELVSWDQTKSCREALEAAKGGFYLSGEEYWAKRGADWANERAQVKVSAAETRFEIALQRLQCLREAWRQAVGIGSSRCSEELGALIHELSSKPLVREISHPVVTENRKVVPWPFQSASWGNDGSLCLDIAEDATGAEEDDFEGETYERVVERGWGLVDALRTQGYEKAKADLRKLADNMECGSATDPPMLNTAALRYAVDVLEDEELSGRYSDGK